MYNKNSVNNIRELFINYFKSHDFIHLPHCPVVSDENDNTLFTVAGMKPFSDFFRNPDIAIYQQIVTVQPCLRISGKHDDLSNIGITTRHQTLFEMLGIFSFGKLTKKDTIHYLWNFFTQILNINKEYLYVTIYKNDNEAYNFWCELIDSDRIARAEMDTNFWSAGAVGLCGPCSEIFFDKEQKPLIESYQSIYLEDRFLEICNMVFMSYDRQNEHDTEEQMRKLPVGCIDVGAGLERVTSVVNETYDNYSVDTIAPIMNVIKKEYSDYWAFLLTSIDKTNNIRDRIVSDHLRAILFIISEGVRPSSRNQGHVLRRLIRRVLSYWWWLECCDDIDINPKALLNMLNTTAESLYYYKGLEKYTVIACDLMIEEMNILNDIIKKCRKYFTDDITEETIVQIHTTFGMPLELAIAICENDYNSDRYQYYPNKKLNYEKIELLIKAHSNKKSFILNTQQVTIKECYDKLESTSTIMELFDKNGNKVKELSGEGYIITKNTPFYAQGGGQHGDLGTIITKTSTANVINTVYQKLAKELYTIIHIVNVESGIMHENDNVNLQVNKKIRLAHTRAHSATHLLYDFLSSKYKILQAGSRVYEDKFTLDIECTEVNKFTNLHQEIENFVNNVINKQIPVNATIVLKNTVPELIQIDKYDDNVRVITMSDSINIYSRQLCGGTHVHNTKDIINFKIISESAISRNTRRFTCVTNYKTQENIQNIVKLEPIYQEHRFQNQLIIECFNANNVEILKMFEKRKPLVAFIVRDSGTNIICSCRYAIAEKIHKAFNCFGILSLKNRYNFGTKQKLNINDFINIITL